MISDLVCYERDRAYGFRYCPHGFRLGVILRTSMQFLLGFVMAVWFRITVDYPNRNYIGASGLGVGCSRILGAGLGSLPVLCGWRGVPKPQNPKPS